VHKSDMQACYCVVRGPALFICQTRRPAVWCAQRLMRDFKRLQQDPPQGVNASPNADNIMLWNAVIFGPEDTPWDGGELLCRHNICWSDENTMLIGCMFAGTFRLTIEFSEEYPNKAPVVKFKSSMFHPNSAPKVQPGLVFLLQRVDC